MIVAPKLALLAVKLSPVPVNNIRQLRRRLAGFYGNDDQSADILKLKAAYFCRRKEFLDAFVIYTHLLQVSTAPFLIRNTCIIFSDLLAVCLHAENLVSSCTVNLNRIIDIQESLISLGICCSAWCFDRRNAMSIFSSYFQDTSFKNQSKLELLDSAILCGLKCSNKMGDCVRLLADFEEQAKTPDQQFQYFHTARTVHRSAGNWHLCQKYLILLIDDNENNPHYWLELGETGQEKKNGQPFTNLEVGCKVRAVELLRKTLVTDVGFAKNKNSKLIQALEVFLQTVDKNALKQAYAAVFPDSIHNFDKSSENDFVYRGDREVRVESRNCVLTADAQFEAVRLFRSKYSWLFQ